MSRNRRLHVSVISSSRKIPNSAEWHLSVGNASLTFSPCDPSPDRLTLEQVAAILEVSNTVVRRLIKEQVLPARQLVSCAPWVIRREDLALPAVQTAAQAVRDGHKRPRTAPGHPELPLESST